MRKDESNAKDGADAADKMEKHRSSHNPHVESTHQSPDEEAQERKKTEGTVHGEQPEESAYKQEQGTKLPAEEE